MKLTIPCQEPIEPKCRHFRICGGCQFQHIPYDEQLFHKEKFIESCFGRKVQPIIAAHPVWRYRNKMEFSFSEDKAGTQYLGLMKKRGRVENLEECFLTNPWFIEVLQNVRAWWEEEGIQAYFPPGNRGLLRTLTVREGLRTGEKMVMLTVSEDAFSESARVSFVEALPNISSVILRRQIVQKGVPTRFEEEVLSGANHIHEILYTEKETAYKFRIRGASFFQPNTCQAEMIYQKAIEVAHLENDERVYDLFCGTGAIGMFASSSAGRVAGIEIVPEAVDDAQYNLAQNGIGNMEIVLGDVGDQLKNLPFEPTTVFVDPPRVGLGNKTIGHLLQLKPPKIVYISCNPVSQAEDCKALIDYEVESLQPIDQFPHTPHVENIALLRRKTLTA